jgi:hypothetical protein
MLKATVTITAANYEGIERALDQAQGELALGKSYSLLSGRDWTATVSRHGQPETPGSEVGAGDAD